MKREKLRSIVVFEDHFKEFKKTLDKAVLKKIYEVFIYIMTIPDIPVKYLKPITSVKGLYEIRVEYGSNTFRIFCCFDEGKLVVLFNGFQKKTQKTPREEISKAESLMKKYFKLKKLIEDESKH